MGKNPEDAQTSIMNFSGVTLNHLENFYINLSSGERSIQERFNKNKRLICSLHGHYTKNYTPPEPPSNCYNHLKERFPKVSRGDVIQLVNGNADINHAHASHLKCLLSYALQFKLLGRKVHLAFVNLPSFGNYQNWNHVKIFSYNNYVEKTITNACGFNPYSSTNILLDADDRNLKLDDVVTSLMKLSKEYLDTAGLIMGMSGGGNFLAGSHGLEWAESIHQSLDKIPKTTLMCHANDSILFTSAHTLLSMSRNETLSLFKTSVKERASKSNEITVEQAHMIDHAIFKNLNDRISKEYTWAENQFLKRCEQLSSDEKLLIIAGPAYLTKFNSSITKFREKYGFKDLLTDLLRSVNGLKVAFIGDNSKLLMDLFPFLNKDNCITLEFTNNFTELMEELISYNKNLCNISKATRKRLDKWNVI